MSSALSAVVLLHAPWVMFGGVAAILIAAAGGPSFLVTGVALTAVGATAALAGRPRVDPVLLAAQMAVYAAIYVLFVGAAIHGAGPRGWLIADLLLSVPVMAMQGPVLQRAARR